MAAIPARSQYSASFFSQRARVWATNHSRFAEPSAGSSVVARAGAVWEPSTVVDVITWGNFADATLETASAPDSQPLPTGSEAGVTTSLIPQDPEPEEQFLVGRRSAKGQQIAQTGEGWSQNGLAEDRQRLGKLLLHVADVTHRRHEIMIDGQIGQGDPGRQPPLCTLA